MDSMRARSFRDLLPVAIVGGLLMGVAYMARGGIGSGSLMLLAAAGGGFALLVRPALGPAALVVAALALRMVIGTGTEVALNAATLLIPALVALWVLHGVAAGRLTRLSSPADRPWVLLLAAGLLSLAIGRVTWDPAVPLRSGFVLVQMAQWAIFAFAALAYWLPGMLIRREEDLRTLTWTFLYIGGGLAVMLLVPGLSRMAGRFATIAFSRAPFIVLLIGVAGGQLLFNRGLSLGQRAYLALLVVAMLYESTFAGRLSISEWVGAWATLGILVWRRFARMRGLVLVALLALVLVAVLFPSLYDFAGGDERWGESGASRLVLSQRVLDVSMRNPVLGLGPAAYRVYAGQTPLPYRDALWYYPQISSHNNYVDIIAQFGLLGLGLFIWLAVTLYRHAAAMARIRTDGFAGGYANGMVAVWVSTLVIMFLADWALPFVYNIGYEGFQASILVWLFMGGLVVLRPRPETQA